MDGSRQLQLAMDQGGSASRAIVFDALGQDRVAARIEVGDSRPRPGWVEQDPDAVVASLRRATESVLASASAADRTQVAACGLSTQRSSLVCWDRGSGAALSPVLSWQDTRAAAWLQAQELDYEAVRATSGLYPNAHFGLGKLRWCLDHLDAVRAAADDGRLLMGPLAAFLAFRLLEQRPALVDPANASRTLLLDLARGDWDESMLARFGIERTWLPKIARSDACYGDLALESGQHIPMRLLSGDQSTAAFAHGELRPEAVYLNVGTGAFVFRASNEPAPGKLLRSVVHWSDAPEYVVEGTVNGAGSALAAFAQQRGITDIATALEEAWQDDASAGDTVYLNGVGGLGSPDWRPDFPSHFVSAGTLGQELVAVAESIVFLIDRNLAELRKLDGPPCEYILASGGISQSDRFCQALSDLTGLPVRRPAHCEATARGAAYLLAGRPKSWVPLSQTDFSPRRSPELETRHLRWQAAMAQGTAA